MKQGLLVSAEIQDACEALRLAFRAISTIQANSPGGRFVQYPKIPSLLSESWIALEVAAGRSPAMPDAKDVARGGALADLVVTTKSGARLAVEVKATGAAGFQYFYAKDTTADVLVWVSFAGFFGAETPGQPTVYWLKNPQEIFQTPTKITLGEFRRRCGARLLESRLSPFVS